MTKSSVTISLVEAARGGPFILWEGLEAGCKTAKDLGFDAVEVFSLGPEQVDSDELEKLLDDYELSLAAVGTGAGMVKHGLPTAVRKGQKPKSSLSRLLKWVADLEPVQSWALCRDVGEVNFPSKTLSNY